MTFDLDRVHEAVATDLLPAVPEPDLSDDGYDWMERLAGTGWRPVAGTADGRLLGDWPYQVVAHYNDPDRGLFGLAVYTEGDIQVEGFRDKKARNTATKAYLAGDEEA